MFEGDLEEGELEIGQVSAMLSKIQPVFEIIDEIWAEFQHYLNHPLK
jgi:enoyl-[acyl-carrier protein] reductase II